MFGQPWDEMRGNEVEEEWCYLRSAWAGTIMSQSLISTGRLYFVGFLFAAVAWFLHPNSSSTLSQVSRWEHSVRLQEACKRWHRTATEIFIDCFTAILFSKLYSISNCVFISLVILSPLLILHLCTVCGVVIKMKKEHNKKKDSG